MSECTVGTYTNAHMSAHMHVRGRTHLASMGAGVHTAAGREGERAGKAGHCEEKRSGCTGALTRVASNMGASINGALLRNVTGASVQSLGTCGALFKCLTITMNWKSGGIAVVSPMK